MEQADDVPHLPYPVKMYIAALVGTNSIPSLHQLSAASRDWYMACNDPFVYVPIIDQDFPFLSSTPPPTTNDTPPPAAQYRSLVSALPTFYPPVLRQALLTAYFRPIDRATIRRQLRLGRHAFPIEAQQVYALASSSFPHSDPRNHSQDAVLCALRLLSGWWHRSSLNVAVSNKMSILHYAALSGHVRVARYVLDSGDPPDPSAWQFSRSPLHAACDGGWVDVVRLFIERGWDPNIGGDYSESPLHSACRGGNLAIVQTLLVAGADVQRRSRFGSTALHVAAGSSNASLDVVETLVSAGLEVDGLDGKGASPLIIAADCGNAALVEWFCRHGAQLDRRRTDGTHALALAVWRGELEVTRVLLDHGVDIELLNDPKSRSGGSPLSLAAFNRRVEVVRLLLQRGADPKKQDAYGRTALHAGCFGGSVEVVLDLLASGGMEAVNTPLDQGTTPLMLAAERGHQEIVQILLASGAEIAAQRLDGITALHRAITRGQVACVEVLLARGVDLDPKEELHPAGWTPLGLACFWGKVSCVERLLAAGADPTRAGPDGSTPLELAKQSGNAEVVALIRRRLLPFGGWWLPGWVLGG